MKSLRILTWICAAYYALHAFGLYAFSALMSLLSNAAPMQMSHEMEDDPAFNLVIEIGRVLRSYAPWLLIGAVVCALLAARLRQTVRIIPGVAIALFVGGAVWLIIGARTVYYMVKAAGIRMTHIMRPLGNANGTDTFWSAGLFVLLPPVLLFIFSRKAIREGLPAL